MHIKHRHFIIVFYLHSRTPRVQKDNVALCLIDQHIFVIWCNCTRSCTVCWFSFVWYCAGNPPYRSSWTSMMLSVCLYAAQKVSWLYCDWYGCHPFCPEELNLVYLVWIGSCISSRHWWSHCHSIPNYAWWEGKCRSNLLRLSHVFKAQVLRTISPFKPFN